MNEFDVVVIGAGHAGCEAAMAASRMGVTTALVTMTPNDIASMPCNPAIGGIGKGQIVRDIDALGGVMGIVADRAGIQFRMLNRKKGSAVHSPRAQEDKGLYQKEMEKLLLGERNLSLVIDEVQEIVINGEGFRGIMTANFRAIKAGACVIATGTYLASRTHIGMDQWEEGPSKKPTSTFLARSLAAAGFGMGRFKTGTPARILKDSIDWARFREQKGDVDPEPFSLQTSAIDIEQIPCYVGETNDKVHEIIRRGLDRSPLYGGRIQGIGPLYCPSIEDKIVRFPEMKAHQLFLEPEGRHSNSIYINGLSTSLPMDVQEELIHAVTGLGNCEILKFGYAIEYDFVLPTQLTHALESKEISGLFTAGQINGTSGYEEAAGQGLVAGINAALKVKKEPPFFVDRSQSFVGVMIDDLVRIGVTTPYRMFTARGEYRLGLGIDTAEERLTRKGFQIGLISKERFEEATERRVKVENAIVRAGRTLVRDATCPREETTTVASLLRRPENTFESLRRTGCLQDFELNKRESRLFEFKLKYAGYIERQATDIERARAKLDIEIPDWLDFEQVPGLKKEVRVSLKERRPRTLAEARLVPGVTPVAVDALRYVIEYRRKPHGERFDPVDR